MGRNSKSSKPNSPFCEKLLKAFGIGVHPKIIKFSTPSPSRHEQRRQQQPNNYEQIHVHHEEANYGVPEMEKRQQNAKNKSGGDEDVNDVFSDYINRAKRRLANMASKRHHDSSSKGKDQNLKQDRRFSDYIVRARNKLRTTSSSVGLAKSTSLK